MIAVNDIVQINNPMSGFNGLTGKVLTIYSDNFKTKPNGDPIMLAKVAIDFPTVSGHATVNEIFPVDFLKEASVGDNVAIDLSESLAPIVDPMRTFKISVKEDNHYTNSPFFFELNNAAEELGIEISFHEIMDRAGNYKLKDYELYCNHAQLEKLLDEFPDLYPYISPKTPELKKIMNGLKPKYLDLSESKEEPTCCICGKKLKDRYDFNNPRGAIYRDGSMIEWKPGSNCCADCDYKHVTLGRILLSTHKLVPQATLTEVGLDRNNINVKKHILDTSTASIDLSESADTTKNYHIFNMDSPDDNTMVWTEISRNTFDYITKTPDYGMLDIYPRDYPDRSSFEDRLNEECDNYATDFISEVVQVGYSGDMKVERGDIIPTISGENYFVRYTDRSIWYGSDDIVSLSNIIEASASKKLDEHLVKAFDPNKFLLEGEKYIKQLTTEEFATFSLDLSENINTFLAKNSDYLTIDDLIDAVDVKSPNSRGAEYPPFDAYAINQSAIPDNMRFKHWEILEDLSLERDEFGIIFKGITQEPFDEADFEKCCNEIIRCIATLLDIKDIDDPLILTIDICPRGASFAERMRKVLTINRDTIATAHIDLSEGRK